MMSSLFKFDTLGIPNLRDLVKLELPLSNDNQDRLRSQLKNISFDYIYSYDFIAKNSESIEVNKKFPHPGRG